MPLIFNKIKGRQTGVFARLLAPNTSAAPTPVTIVVAAAGAAAGVNSIPVVALTAAVPKNTVLTFEGAEDVVVVTTADAALAATSLAVQAYFGKAGDGISAALVEDDEATWDGLYTDVGANTSDYANNSSVQNLAASIYDAPGAVSIDEVDVTSLSPTVSRGGFISEDSPLFKDLLRYADTNRNWWLKHVIPDASGAPLFHREGLAKVTGFTHSQNADGLITASFTYTYVSNEPTLVFYDE